MQYSNESGMDVVREIFARYKVGLSKHVNSINERGIVAYCKSPPNCFSNRWDFKVYLNRTTLEVLDKKIDLCDPTSLDEISIICEKIKSLWETETQKITKLQL